MWKSKNEMQDDSCEQHDDTILSPSESDESDDSSEADLSFNENASKIRSEDTYHETTSEEENEESQDLEYRSCYSVLCKEEANSSNAPQKQLLNYAGLPDELQELKIDDKTPWSRSSSTLSSSSSDGTCTPHSLHNVLNSGPKYILAAGIPYDVNYLQRKLLRQQLTLLLHAQQCQTGKQTKAKCKVVACKNVKMVLVHLRVCKLGKYCNYIQCPSSKKVILHWKTCRQQFCLLCYPIKKCGLIPGAEKGGQFDDIDTSPMEKSRSPLGKRTWDAANCSPPGPLSPTPSNASSIPDQNAEEDEGEEPPLLQFTPENKRGVRLQLNILYHVHRCLIREARTSDARKCPIPSCLKMRTVLQHMGNCKDRAMCSLPECALMWQIVDHHPRCLTSGCKLCASSKRTHKICKLRVANYPPGSSSSTTESKEEQPGPSVSATAAAATAVAAAVAPQQQRSDRDRDRDRGRERVRVRGRCLSPHLEEVPLAELDGRDAGAGAAGGDSRDRRRLIQRQLLVLLHARRCGDSAAPRGGIHKKKGPRKGQAPLQAKCSIQHCNLIRKVLKHMETCKVGVSCEEPHCGSSKSILNHWEKCSKTDCVVCEPVKRVMKLTSKAKVVKSFWLPSP